MYTSILGDTLDNRILDQVPKRIIIGFFDNKAFNGNRRMNPLNFRHLSINNLTLYIDGVQIPSTPLQSCFTGANELYVDSFQTLVPGIWINRYNYIIGDSLSAFDRTPDLSAHCASYSNLVRSDSVRMKVRFEEAETNTIICIVYTL